MLSRILLFSSMVAGILLPFDVIIPTDSKYLLLKLDNLDTKIDLQNVVEGRCPTHGQGIFKGD